jgi:hypothetical protein
VISLNFDFVDFYFTLTYKSRSICSELFSKEFVKNWCGLGTGRVQESRGKETSTVRSRYQKAAEDTNLSVTATAKCNRELSVKVYNKFCFQSNTGYASILSKHLYMNACMA